MDNATIVIIVILSLCFLGVGIWWFFRRQQYMYWFIKFNRDFGGFTRHKARLVPDKRNPAVKNFQIKGFEQVLQKRSANWYENGRPRWIVTTDDNGDLIYMNPKEAFVKDEQRYFEFQLMPEERSALVNQIGDAQVLYQPENSLAKFMMVSLIMFLVIMLIFNSYTAYQQVQTMKETSTVASRNYDIANIHTENLKILLAITEKLYSDYPDEFKNTIIELEESPTEVE